MNQRDLDINIKEESKRYSNLQVPSEISKMIDNTLKELPDKNINSIRNLNKVIKKTAIVASIAFAISIGGIIISPAIAETLEKLPLVGSAFKLVGDVGLRLISEKDPSININKTQVYKNKKLTITNIAYEESRISIGYLLENKDKVSDISWSIMINGKEIKWVSARSKGDFIDENNYAGIINVDLGEKLEDTFNLDILIKESTEIIKFDFVIAKWKFKDLEIKKQESKVLKPNVTKKIEDKIISVEKMTLSDVSTEILIDEKSPLVLDKHGRIIKRNDMFYAGSHYQMEDDKGKELEILQQSGRDEMGKDYITKNRIRLEPIDEDVKYLIFRRYNTEEGMKYQDIKREITEQLPMIIDIGEDSNITINKIQYNNDKILIHYSYYGILPYDFSRFIVEVEDGNEKEGIEILYHKSIGSLEDEYNFILEAKIDDKYKDKKLYISATKIPKLEKYLELKIPVK